MATRDNPKDTDIVLLAYDSSGNLEYAGFSTPGTATSASEWKIKKLSYTSGNMTSVLFPSGSPSYSWVWDNRASYTYS